MSARSTTTPSLAQRYCCFRREPHPLCSKLNEMPAEACVAEYSFTGMDTMPKATVSEAIERAAMMDLSLLIFGLASCRNGLQRRFGWPCPAPSSRRYEIRAGTVDPAKMISKVQAET